ncbi:MAG: TonB-dependent receptor plug [Ignavibacteria bacterium]|nr:MAG: TonB-dependent receptor plug [Ignavibacteria bacterium]KAF0156899.1 MAG: TonB-dependent receptor plug [Ignavibacteria bacterium]
MCLIPSLLLFAQTGTLSGRVINEKAEPVFGASVIIVGTSLGASADELGYFQIKNISVGTYSVQVSAISYEKKTVSNLQINELTKPITVILKESLIQTQQIVVSAGKYEQRIRDLTVSTTVLQPEEISKKNHLTFDDYLRHVPGVQVNLEQVSIRGSSGYSKGAGTRVLVALNGLPMYSGDSGDIVWEMIPIADIERVEIIKGPASSLYGSTAIGGVINIITKGSIKKPITNFRTYFGLYDKPSYDVWDWSNSYRNFYGAELTHSNSYNNLGYTFSFKKFDNDSYRQNNFSKRYLGYLKLNYDFNYTSRLTFFANYLSMNRGNFLYWKDSRNALVPKDEDNGNTVKSDRIFTGLIYQNHLSEILTTEIKANYYRTKFTGYGLEVTTSTADLLRGEALANYKASKNLFLTSGLELSYANVESNIFKNPTFFGAAAYTQSEYKGIAGLILTAGIRYDYIKMDSTSGKMAVTPRAGLNYKFSDDLILRASVGTGFRAPTPSEVFTSTAVGGGVNVIENPNLTYETSLSFEAGIHYSMQQVSLDAAFYQNDYKNFIEPNFTETGTNIQFVNIPKARIQGVELVGAWNIIPSLLNFSVGYNYMWSRDIGKNKSMKYRPRNTASTNLLFTPASLEFGIDFRYLSRIEEIDPLMLIVVVDGEIRVPTYITDIMAGYNFFIMDIPAKVFINAKNVFNYNHVEFIGNLAPIRNYSLSFELFF